MNHNEAYCNADGDVYWGPYTKEEFLIDVMQTRNNISVRHTVCCDPRFINDVEKRGDELIQPEAETPSPGFIKSHAFIEKISEILNTDNAQNNSYNNMQMPEIVINDVTLNITENDDINDTNEINIIETVTQDDNSFSSNESRGKNEGGYIETIEIISDSEEEEIEDNAWSKKSIKSENSSITKDEDYYTSNESRKISNCGDMYHKVFETNPHLSEVNNIEDESTLNFYSFSTAHCESTSATQETNETDEIFKFNDTLEEINGILNKGNNNNNSVSSEEQVQKKPNIPTSLIPIPCKINQIATKPNSNFKIPPEKPERFKLLSPVHNKEKFKYIQSPIAVYIKNTTTPVFKKVTPKHKKDGTSEKNRPTVEKKGKENKKEICDVIYKKSKNTIIREQTIFKLPNNIESLLPQSGCVTKHLEKSGGNKNSISRKLLQDDLSLNTTSENSYLHRSSQNVSTYEIKRVF